VRLDLRRLFRISPSGVTSCFAAGLTNGGLADRVSPIFNTVISNIPGVSVPLYSMGSRMVATFGLGPLTHGMGLFHAVLSYHNTITISLIADRDMMPDPSFYCRCMEEAFEELKKATIDIEPAKKSAGRNKKKNKKKTSRAKTSALKANGGAQAQDSPHT
jgi:hypothetical protein